MSAMSDAEQSKSSPDRTVEQATGKSIRRAERAVVLTIILFAAALFAAAVYAGGRETLAHITGLSWHLLVLVFSLSLLNYFCRAVRWQVCAKAMSFTVPFHLNCLYYFAGFAMTTTPGKVGEALRLWLLRRAHGLPYDKTAGLLIADRLSDACAMVLVVLLSVAGVTSYLWISVVAAVGMIFVTAVFLKPRIILMFVDFVYARVRRAPRFFARVRRSVRQLERLANIRIFSMTLALGVVGWLAEASAFSFLLHALGADISYLAAVFIFAFAMVVGAIIILPGGLGGVEATMIGLLVALNVPMDVAIAATAVIRLATLWFAVALGFIALAPALRRANKGVALA